MDEQIETSGLPEQNELGLPTVDFTELETKIDKLVEVLVTDQEQKKAEAEKLAEEEKQKAVEDEKNLKEEQLKTAKDAKLQAETTEKEHDLLQSLVTAVDEMAVANEGYHAETIELMEKQHKDNVEGFYFVGLSIVIAFAVYMFWNQLSKW
ncbi:hypothetical protein LSPCS325_53640 [Lysinibacillus sp. CTST325]